MPRFMPKPANETQLFMAELDMSLSGFKPKMMEFQLQLMKCPQRKLHVDPKAPMVQVVRVEQRGDPYEGAWNGQPDDEENLTWHLDLMARKLGVKGPSHFPAVWAEEFAKQWTLQYYCGFKDLDQSKMWFDHPKIRAALYDNPHTCMRLYEVSQSLVLYGKYQIGFVLDKAKVVREIQREEFV